MSPANSISTLPLNSRPLGEMIGSPRTSPRRPLHSVKDQLTHGCNDSFAFDDLAKGVQANDQRGVALTIIGAISSAITKCIRVVRYIDCLTGLTTSQYPTRRFGIRFSLLFTFCSFFSILSTPFWEILHWILVVHYLLGESE